MTLSRRRFLLGSSALAAASELPSAALAQSSYNPWQWRTYNYYGNDMPVADLPWDYVTHILDVFVGININGDVAVDMLAPMQSHIVPLITAAHAHGVKVLLCVGALSGGTPATQSDVNLYNSIVNNGGWVAAAKIMAFVNQYGYDGVALDLEPAAGNLTSTFAVWTSLMKNLRQQLVNPKILTCNAVSDPGHAQMWGGSEALSYLDRLHLMTFNLYAYSLGRTTHNASLYGGTTFADYASFSVDANVQDYLRRGVPANRINIVLPFYGKELFGYAGPNLGLGAHQPGTAPDAELDYNVIVNNHLPGATVHVDDVARVPWASVPDNSRWYSYDDAMSIRAKVDYVRARGLGGVDAHHIGGQNFPNAIIKNPLWQAVEDGFAAPPPAQEAAAIVEVDVGSLFRPNGWGQVFSGRIFGDGIPSTLWCYIFSKSNPEQLLSYMPNVSTVGGVWSVVNNSVVGPGTYWFYVFGPSNKMLAKLPFVVFP
jgi:GH18 family chitinase